MVYGSGHWMSDDDFRGVFESLTSRYEHHVSAVSLVL
jgi:hypothetical protein